MPENSRQTLNSKASAQTNPFFARVYHIVRQIPMGKVVSYGQIAWLLGAPRAARKVGWAMRRCPDGLPWQRVVKGDGAIVGGEYAPLRRAMLEKEGIGFTPDGRVDMEVFRWQPEDASLLVFPE